MFIPNPPDPVSDLTALPGSVEGEVALVWTAPANQNLIAVSSYEVRFATFSASSVGSTTTWSAAASSTAFAAALPPGSLESRSIGGLFPAATWYFSVKSIDATGEVSEIDTKSTGAFQAEGEYDAATSSYTFRGDGPEAFFKNVEAQIRSFQKGGVTEYAKAVAAWRESPLFDLYRSIARESLVSKTPLAAVIAARAQRGEVVLEEPIVEAIRALNERIRLA